MYLDDSLNVSEEGFPVHGGPKEKLCFLLNYAVLAPRDTILTLQHIGHELPEAL